MQAYFEQDGIKLYHGDCRDVLPALDLKADAVITDAPYGETEIHWDRWPVGWLASLQSIATSTTNLWCFGSMRMFLERLPEFTDWRFVQEIVWEKHNGSGFHVDRFRRVHELLFHFVPRRAKWKEVYRETQFTNDAVARTVRRKAKPPHWHGARKANSYQSIDGGPRQMRSVLKVRSMHGRAIHPTQKPVELLTPIVRYSCPPNGLVIDPFGGSGSTAAACRESGRRCILIEADEAECEKAANRLRALDN